MTITSPIQTFVDRQAIRDFLDGRIQFFELPEPQWGPIGKEVFERTYARTVDVVTSDGEVLGTRIESWADTVRRVVQGSLSYVGREHWLNDEDVELFDLIYNFKALPAGRHLWVTGTPASTFSKNCWSAGFGARTSSHFAFLASRLLEGGGVGSNYSSDVMAATEKIRGSIRLSFRLDENHADFERVQAVAQDRLNIAEMADYEIVVEDNREGWVSTWTKIIDLSVGLPGERSVVIDLSDVRPFGAELKTFGGTASGPDALVRSLLGMAEVLNNVVASSWSGRRLTGLEAMTIDHELASAIVAGGARRSARMAIMSWRDIEVFDFIHIKENTQSHWTTNISVEIDDDFHAALANPHFEEHAHAEAVLREIVTGMVRNGEPGMVDTDYFSRDEAREVRITNPCITGDTWVQTTKGLRQVNDLVSSGAIDLVIDNRTTRTTSDGFFSTGTKDIIEVNVDGTVMKVTPDHLVMTPDGWRPAGDLAEGDVVTLTDSLGNTWGGRGTESEGYLVGHFLGDGQFEMKSETEVSTAQLCVWKNDEGSETVKIKVLEILNELGAIHHANYLGWRPSGDGKETLSSAWLRDLLAQFEVTRGNKTVTPEMMETSSAFATGLIRGLFDTDGHVEGKSTGGGLSVRLSQSNPLLLGNVRTLLLSLGIKSAVRSLKPAGYRDMPGGNYYCQESFRLVISGDHVDRFAKLIGFENQVKFAKLINGISTMTRGFYIKPMVGTVIGVADGGTLPVYDCTVPDGHAFVANGTVVHNCGEVGLNSYDVDGLIAGESCNLGSIDLDVFGTDHEGAKKAFQLMARFLYRSTLNPHRDSLASHIETSNRRIGVGIMGLQGWTAAHGVRLSELEHNATLRHLLSEFRQTTRSAADAFARELGLPLPLKVTAVAPTGSIAQLRGSQPGIHPVYARYFKRRVRYSKADLGLSALRDAGHHVEDDLYAANTSVVEFFVKDSILDRYEESLIEQSDELSADQFFGLIATVQETFCGSGDGNAVSATAQIAPDMDAEELSAAVRGRLGTVKGLTVFPSISRPQSPYETISAARYSDAVLSGLAQSSGDSNSGGCVGGACPIR
jgi:ribonucleotide reductase alpha subunit